MNGKYNGLIAIHGCNAATVEEAISLAKDRFIDSFAKKLTISFAF